MKKLLIILFAFMLSGVTGMNAQFRYGPVAGVNISKLSFNQDLFDVSQAVGFQAGVQAELMFPGIGFGIDFGLLYNQATSFANIGQREVWASQGFGRQRMMLHQIDIPVHLRFKWTRMNGLEEKIAPFVYGGPEFLLNCGHSKVKGNPGVENPFTYSGGGLGLTAGLGFELWRSWQISASYTWGMSYMVKTKLLDDFSGRSSQWTVRVAYLF